MKISVRPVNLESEKQELLNILQTNLPHLPHGLRFDWMYRANPDGVAWAWFVFEGSPDNVVGLASVFPRSMWIGNDLKKCGQVGDFAIAASHRSLGPAVLLQRATFAPVDQDELAFCYDCPPHEAGMSTFRRLGIAANCRVDRYALPLRTDSHARKRFGSAAAVPAAAGNLLLRLHRWPTSKLGGRDIEVAEHTGSFGEEFSQLDAAVKNANSIRGQRSAAHLNWRYRLDPVQQFQVMTARRKGELLAFVIFQAKSEIVTIVDLFGIELGEAAPALLTAIVKRFQGSHQTVESFLSEGNGLIAQFERMRFRRRSDAARIVAYAKSEGETSQFLQGAPRWAFTQAEVRA